MSDGFVSKADFASIYGCSRGYVSQLVGAGRLVLSDDGKRVNVEASLQQLGVTADPTKAGVRERWAAYRDGRGVVAQPASSAPGAAPTAAEASRQMDLAAYEEAELIRVRNALLRGDDAAPAGDAAQAEATAAAAMTEADRRGREEARDLAAKRAAVRLDIDDVDKQLRQLDLLDRLRKVAEVDPMIRAVVDSHTAARTEVLGLADRLTPLVTAETEARKVYDIIQAECERICDRMRQRVEQLRDQHQAAVSA